MTLQLVNVLIWQDLHDIVMMTIGLRSLKWNFHSFRLLNWLVCLSLFFDYPEFGNFCVSKWRLLEYESIKWKQFEIQEHLTRCHWKVIRCLKSCIEVDCHFENIVIIETNQRNSRWSDSLRGAHRTWPKHFLIKFTDNLEKWEKDFH